MVTLKRQTEFVDLKIIVHREMVWKDEQANLFGSKSAFLPSCPRIRSRGMELSVLQSLTESGWRLQVSSRNMSGRRDELGFRQDSICHWSKSLTYSPEILPFLTDAEALQEFSFDFQAPARASGTTSSVHGRALQSYRTSIWKHSIVGRGRDSEMESGTG